MDVDLPGVISRWAHVGTAIILVGGTFFMRFVLHPALDESSEELMTRVRSRWKKFVHGGIALFLISGFYNYFQAMPLHKGDGLYHGLIGTKLLLAFFVFFLASVLVGRSPGTQKYRDNAPKWAGILVIVAVLIVAISGFVKVRGLPNTPAAETPAAETPEAETSDVADQDAA